MKSLIIITLSFCLHSTFLHANDEDKQPWGRFGKQSSIGLYSSLIAGGTTLTLLGMKKIYSAVKPMTNTENSIESHTSINHRTYEAQNGLLAIGMGVTFTTLGYCYLISGLANEVESLKDN